MKLELFINFGGNCREAVEFYARVFRSKIGNLLTYDDDSGEDFNARIFRRFPAGTYYIEVRTWGGSTGRSTLYIEPR